MIQWVKPSHVFAAALNYHLSERLATCFFETIKKNKIFLKIALLNELKKKYFQGL